MEQVDEGEQDADAEEDEGSFDEPLGSGGESDRTRALHRRSN